MTRTLAPTMRIGRRLLRLYSRRPGLLHRLLDTPPGRRVFLRFCPGEGFPPALDWPPARAALALLAT